MNAMPLLCSWHTPEGSHLQHCKPRKCQRSWEEPGWLSQEAQLCNRSRAGYVPLGTPIQEQDGAAQQGWWDGVSISITCKVWVGTSLASLSDGATLAGCILESCISVRESSGDIESSGSEAPVIYQPPWSPCGRSRLHGACFGPQRCCPRGFAEQCWLAARVATTERAFVVHKGSSFGVQVPSQHWGMGRNVTLQPAAGWMLF